MKRRWKKLLLCSLAMMIPAVGFAIAWVIGGPFSFASAAAKANEEAPLLNSRDPQRMLTEANRFYWGHNLPLPDARPVISRTPFFHFGTLERPSTFAVASRLAVARVPMKAAPRPPL
jgi:hypothetical protein